MLYQDYFDKYLKILSFRNFRPHSVSSYCTYIRPYLEYLEQVLQKRPEEASWDDYRDFIMFIQSERDLNDRTVNTMITHLSLFHSTVLDKEWNKKQIPFRKFDEYVPYIPSHERITFFINSIQDLKVKAMVSLMYSSGMRVSEVCSLKCGDIYRSQGYILVRTSKSRIPRQAICSQNAMAIVIEYWKSLPLPRPGKDNYLFPKQSGKDAPIDTFFPLRRMIDQEKLLGWDHLITCHTLRRACANIFTKTSTSLRISEKSLVIVMSIQPDYTSGMSSILPREYAVLSTRNHQQKRRLHHAEIKYDRR